jgi:rhodanese-related sulfurtransferase
MRINKYWISFLFAVTLLIGCNTEAQKTNLSVADFEKAITEQKIQLLDVRTAGEYESGHLKNSLQADWTNKEQFVQRVKSLDKNIPVYTYCLSGARSGAAVQWLNKNGYKAYNLEGGIKSWNNAGKAIEQKSKGPQMSMAAYLQQIPADKTVLVDFGAEWCPPCKKMEVVIKELQATHGTKFLLLKIDGAAQSNLVKEMNIEEFPSFIIYKEGKPVWKKQGLVDKATLIEQL